MPRRSRPPEPCRSARAQRPGEKEGVNYHFVTTAIFRQMVAEGAFLESAEVFGHHYGTSQHWVKDTLKAGRDVVLEIDWQGAQQVRRLLPEAIWIFILPPSREELERRLRSRGQDADDEIARRLSRARDEIAAFGKYYDYCVVNDEVVRAGREAQSILIALRCSSARS